MTTVVWTARVVPLDNPTERWDSSDFALARERPWRIPVLVSHDPEIEVGRLFLIHERGGWVEADLILADTPIGREAAEYMRIGQPVSVGAREMVRSGVRWVRELSIVERGAVPGAQVIGRRELRSSTTAPPAQTTLDQHLRRRVQHTQTRARLEALGLDVSNYRPPLPLHRWEHNPAPSAWPPGTIVRDLPDGRQEITYAHGHAPSIRRTFKPPTITVR